MPSILAMPPLLLHLLQYPQLLTWYKYMSMMEPVLQEISSLVTTFLEITIVYRNYEKGTLLSFILNLVM